MTGLCFPEAMVRTEEGRWRGKKRPDGEDRRGLIVRTEEDRRGLMARTEEDRWREPKRTDGEDRWRYYPQEEKHKPEMIL